MKPYAFIVVLLCISSSASAETFVSMERRLDLDALVYDVAPSGLATFRDEVHQTSGTFAAADFVVTASHASVPGLTCTIVTAQQVIERGTIVDVTPSATTRVQWTDRTAPVRCHARTSRAHFTGTLHIGRTRYSTLTRKETPP